MLTFGEEDANCASTVGSLWVVFPYGPGKQTPYSVYKQRVSIPQVCRALMANPFRALSFISLRRGAILGRDGRVAPTRSAVVTRYTEIPFSAIRRIELLTEWQPGQTRSVLMVFGMRLVYTSNTHTCTLYIVQLGCYMAIIASSDNAVQLSWTNLN